MMLGLKNFVTSRDFGLWFALLLATVANKGWAAEFQKFSITPESVEVAEGEDVFLSCAVENQQGKAQWTKDGFALGFERHVPGYPRYSYAGDPDLGEHHLVISGVTLTEDGEYQCQVGPTISSPPIWAAANVTVLLPPTGISIVGWGDGAVVEVVAGTSLTLECLVSDARPAPKAAWFRDGIQVDPELQEDHVEASSLPRRWNVRSQLIVVAEAEDDGKQFSCQALHPTLKESPTSLVASITLSVLHPPGNPVITGYENSEDLRAGERRTLSCKVTGGNPRPWVLWYRGGQLVDDTTTTDATGVINTHELAVTAEEDGAVYECSVTNDLMEQSLSANVTLRVFYKPTTVIITGPSEVQEGSPINLTCKSSESNPPASLTWTVDGEVMETSKSVAEKADTGGWMTSSVLNEYVVTSRNATEIHVECRAINPTIDEVVKTKKVIIITRPAGRPIFENDLRSEIVSGTTLDLTCLSIGGHPPPKIRIYKEDEEIVTELLHEGNVTLARAEIEVTPVDNGAKVTCEVTNPATETPLTTSSRLKVLFPPWEMKGSATPGTVEEGSPVTLSCTSSSSLPPSNITWRSGGAIMEGATVDVTQGAFGGTDTRSEIELATTAEDNGRVFICEADNGLGSTVNKKIKLNVLHSPIWMVKPQPHMDVYEGANAVITATAAANPGPLRYWWRKGEETLQTTDGELQLGKVTREHSGNYTVNAYTPRGAVNASFFLNVQYGPYHVQSTERSTVGQNGSLSVECSATGNPTPKITWTKDTHAHNSSAQTLSTGLGIARLVINSARPSDTGVYLCQASNVVSTAPAVKTKIIVTQPVRVAKEVAGWSGSWAPVGGSGRLVCRVRAAPVPSFSWSTQDGHIIQNNEKYTIHEPQLVDGLVLWASVFEIRQVTRTDYVSYRCTATNALGTDKADIALNPPARPLPPTNFSIINITASSVSLAWTPNFDGGLPRGYTIQYWISGTLNHKTVEITGGNTAGTTVAELVPGTEYFFTIRSENDQGMSDYITPSLVAHTRGPSGDASTMVGNTSRVPRLILLIMTLTGAALLVLNIAIIACFVRRRTMNRNASASSSTKTVALDAYGATPASTPGTNHNEVLLSLTTINANNLTSTPPGCKDEEQTNVDECDRALMVTPNISNSRTHLNTLQNGGVTRSNSSNSRNGSLLVRNNSLNPQNSGTQNQNGGIPSQQQQQQQLIGSNGSPSGGSPLPQNGRLLNPDSKSTIQPPTNPEVCSLNSSTYDSQPPMQPLQRKNSATYPSDDQISLASYHSNHSRTYSQGYVRPLPPAGCPHHPPRPQQPPSYQPSQQLYQQQDPQHQTIQGPPAYSSLNPSGLYSLSSEYYDARCNQSSFSSGTPMGYATLGPRSRRPQPSQFATLQRPRSSRAQNHSLSHVRQGGSFDGECCQQQRPQEEEGDRLSLSVCGSPSDPRQAQQDNPRRSSFHGPLRRESPHFDPARQMQHMRLQQHQQQHQQAQQQQQQLQPLHQQQQQQQQDSNGTSGYNKRHHQEVSRGSMVNLGRDSNETVGPNLLTQGNANGSHRDLTMSDGNQSPSRGSPVRKGSIHTPTDSVSGRPRFPHDYVRQGSTKSRSSSRGAKDQQLNDAMSDKNQR
ncbi:nephrin-like [Macrobrachium rosenbergii]|uniref:nephrin-like n=1 Tax=Macrobrachium rosenbergii TaxID=79674 RepID=UPI0034D3E88E